MTNKKSTKHVLLMSALALLLCVSMLVGSTYAWFTDSVTSTGNKIQSGSLVLDLSVWNVETDAWESIKESKEPLFNYEKWEPGYMAVQLLKVENKGSLALKWLAKFVSDATPGILANVIDVYVLPYGVLADDTTVALPAGRDLTGYTRVGTASEFINTIKDTTNGTLKAGEAAYLGIALKMQEGAGNDYQDKTLGAFDIQILATQLTYEPDSFDNQYDKEAPLDFAPVSNANELRIAINNKEENILLTNDIIVDGEFSLDYDANINGGGNAIYRADGTAVMALAADEPTIHTGKVFIVKTGATLTLENVIVDGGAVWTGETNKYLGRGTVNAGISATDALITTEGNGSIVLNEGVVLQNNDGANAIFINTRGGGSLTLNGAQIINNTSAAGAIWGGSNITVNEGTVISGNHATTIGGAFRMVDGNNAITFTMNGGKINNNYTDGNGGAIWGGNDAKYFFNSGEMANNYAVGAGGAIWTGTYESYTISGDFKLYNNACGANIGGGIRFADHASLTMTGGEIYGNKAAGKSDAFYLNNNSASITGGKITDDLGYSGGLGLTWGEAELDGVVNFNLSTNHNTAYLAKEFATLKFTVNEGATNFAMFNFEPAEGYVYTEGDEAKLICMNEGYSTYWDAASSTFRLKAN